VSVDLVDGSRRVPAELRVLRSSRRHWLAVLGSSTAFVAGGILMLLSRATLGWLVVAFFGLCALVAGCQVVWPSVLTVSESSFEVRHFRRRVTRSLAQCSEFEVWRSPVGSRALIVFDHPSGQGGLIGRTNRRLSGRSTALPDTYGLAPDVLARLLNDARARAVSQAKAADDPRAGSSQ